MTQPNPDVSGYTDLSVYDVSDQQIFDAALALAQINLPEWTPREGAVEVLLLEAVALASSEAVVAINRLPGALLETLLKIAKVTKDYGTAPTALANVYASDPTGHTVPAGTRLYVPTTDGSGTVVMLVEPPGGEIPVGSTQCTVSLIGDVFTSAANGVPSGTLLQMASPLPWVDRVQLISPVADGADPESDDDWRDRGVRRLSRLSEALVVADHFESAALEYPEVAKAVAVDNTDPTTTGVGDDPGHISVALLGDGGATLSTTTKNTIQAALQGLAFPSLSVHVVDVAITTVTVAVQIHLDASADPTSVTTAVRNALISYLDPLTWTGGQVVRRNEIISISDRVPGVDYVNTVTITGGDASGNLNLATPSTLPKGTAASITVTVI